ncbi:hypothetical protein ColLi_03665 [Colletotrichum liriopes]|uniref:Uncharacterized protein n=1 Tax=Colletotrichum liriopes TaxID=708192 RepID=A0AA37GHJ4_9PEZI|nr:hypothetical protein ColLi_03665 [Colletotrichum liriopes]
MSYSLGPASGAPYITGAKTQPYLMYKQLASDSGDSFFIINRRMQLQLTSTDRPSWSFLYYYVNFVNHLDPNGKKGDSPPANMSYIGERPRYTPESPTVLRYVNESNEIIPYSSRARSYEYYRHTADAWRD